MDLRPIQIFATFFLLSSSLANPPSGHNNSGEPSGQVGALPEQDCSAIGQVLKMNGGKFPQSGTELRQQLEKLGKVRDLGNPFSDAPENTDLINTRVVLAMDEPESFKFDPNRPNLAGKLFFGSNLHWDPVAKKMGVKKMEFISWNEATRRFDFGVIENFGTASAKAVLTDRDTCIGCHKTGGPILQPNPWGNSVNMDATKEASLRAFRALDPQFGSVSEFTEIEGTRPFFARDADLVDQMVRKGTSLLRSNENMTLLPPGSKREGATKGMIRSALGDFFSDGAVRTLFGNTDLDDSKLASSKPDRIRNFIPPTLVPEQAGESSEERDIARAIEYNRLRREGKVKLPMEYQPSNPKAFEEQRGFRQDPFNDIFNAQRVRNGMGLGEGARRFVLEVIDQAASVIPEKDGLKARAMLLEDLANAEELRPFVSAGILPSSQSLIALLPAAIPRILKEKYGVTKSIALLQKIKIKASRCDPKSTLPLGTASSVMHACNRCHAGPGVGNKMRLAFDPLNVSAREAWVKNKNNDRKVVRTELERLNLYLFDAGVMPPSGEPEAAFFDKRPEEWKALKKFVQEELKKVE